MTDFAAARHNMIESQVRPNGITDRRIIAAMKDLPREDFVPEGRRAIAYLDGDVPLAPADPGPGPRVLLAAMPFARLLQHAAIKPTDRALLVGAGTGYGAAVVAALAAHVVALECDPGLAAAARANLAGLANVKLVEGRLESGDPADAPFDVIVLEGRVGEVPQALIDQLADGGRLVAIVGETELARARVYTRSGAAVASRAVFDASVAPLPGFHRTIPAFVF